jgi:anaerobic dimethyl sulfoxide reductase subunit B (iron-sulfur subunit)
MSQYAFFFDQSRCYDCKACALACKSWNGLEPGPEKWLRVFEWEEGTFPHTRLKALFAPCYHCENPACKDVCPEEAIFKEDAYGAVLVDAARCSGCRSCFDACAFGAPQFATTSSKKKMGKCTMCIDRLVEGLMPLCVLSCPLRALDFGSLEAMVEKYGDLRRLPEMPESESLLPSIVFKPQARREVLVEYDAQRAFELLGTRGTLPALYDVAAEGFDSGQDIVGRPSLNMKPKDEKEFTFLTQNDEG